uniref:RNase H type-1 domain-containing protein n=1 Tax=Rhizophora mucronata TaxID=61149 RepID=A0A2P2J4H8_RHIMU
MKQLFNHIISFQWRCLLAIELDITAICLESDCLIVINTILGHQGENSINGQLTKDISEEEWN